MACSRLTADMLALIESAHLCFAATVSADGRPNVSPKGTIRAWNDTTLFFLDIASPGTRANLAARPWMELNIVDHLSRRGYRFAGEATVHQGGHVFDEACRRIFSEDDVTYDVAGVVLLMIAVAAPLISPGYAHVPDERAMRKRWRHRRQALDDAFEAFLFGPADPRRPA